MMPAPAMSATCENSSVDGVLASLSTRVYEERSFGTSIQGGSHSGFFYLLVRTERSVGVPAREKGGEEWEKPPLKYWKHDTNRILPEQL